MATDLDQFDEEGEPHNDAEEMEAAAALDEMADEVKNAQSNNVQYTMNEGLWMEVPDSISDAYITKKPLTMRAERKALEKEVPFQCIPKDYIKNVVHFEDNSILPLPGCSEASGVKSVWGEVSREGPKHHEKM